MDLFTDAVRQNPYPTYAKVRALAPVLPVPAFRAWLVFDYDGVRQVVSDAQTFSSRVPAPDWFIFDDPPRHTKLRGLISKAFTPRSIAALEGRIGEISRQLLDRLAGRREFDLATEYAAILPMTVIAEMIGIPTEDRARFDRWSDAILALSYELLRSTEGVSAVSAFHDVTVEMRQYVAEQVARRQAEPRDDLLTRLSQAEVDGERLSLDEINAFVQLLLVGGQETTANLINNAMLCFMENPAELQRVRDDPLLLPGAIEEVLRYRSPLQWLMRTPTRDVELGGRRIPAGELVLAMVGSANRDPAKFADADRFDVTRDPNPHLAFGHGSHFCMGAALSRMEARVALTDLLARYGHFERAVDGPWEPRRGLHVHGPAELPIRVERR